MPFRALAIAFSNFLNHKIPNEHPLGCLHPPFSLEYVFHHSWYLYSFTWNFHQDYYTTLPFGGSPSSVFNDTYNKHDYWKQNIMPMELYNTTYCSIYIGHCWKHDNHIVYLSFITQLITVFTIKTTQNYAHLIQPKNKHTAYGALYLIHLDTIFTIIYTYMHMHIFFNQKIKGYDGCICNKGIHKLTPPPSK